MALNIRPTREVKSRESAHTVARKYICGALGVVYPPESTVRAQLATEPACRQYVHATQDRTTNPFECTSRAICAHDR